ncbi:type II toxin-antitoxin system HigA family antitoxin [Algoriphagus sp.]|uniref:helix-turn-helix domain-containing protein n=1 Tax=Algoriphagus sp. TaxID=1872435 RepID=UPI00391AD4E5
MQLDSFPYFEHQLAFIRFIGTHPDPIEAIKIRMEEMQLKQVDLISEIGGKSQVSEILNRIRRLTVDMIRKFAVRLNLSANLLIQDYQLVW